MRTFKTVYKRDGTPIEVVTIENEKSPSVPASKEQDIKAEQVKVVQSTTLHLKPKASMSEPDR